MKPMELYIYKKTPKSKPKLVLITDGSFEVRGRISNFWSFRTVKEDGTLSETKGGDYDNETWKFVPVKESDYDVTVQISAKLRDKIFYGG